MTAGPRSLLARRVAGVMLMVIGVALWFAMMTFGRNAGAIVGALLGAAGAVSALGGRSIYNRARQLALPREITVPDARGAVLYLRSFAEDRETAQGASSGVAFGALAVRTEEEQLVAALSTIGSVVAVGEPGEELPPLGAARVQFRHEDWQRGVENLLQQAALVVIRPGSLTGGVRWEVQRALDVVAPERLLIIIDGRVGKHQDADLEKIAVQLNPMLPESIPVVYPKRKLYRLGTARAFVSFNEAWRPTLLPIAVDLVPFFKRSPRSRLIPYFRETLRPAVTRLGYSLPATATSATQVTIVGCFGLFFLVAFIQIILVLVAS